MTSQVCALLFQHRVHCFIRTISSFRNPLKRVALILSPTPAAHCASTEMKNRGDIIPNPSVEAPWTENEAQRKSHPNPATDDDSSPTPPSTPSTAATSPSHKTTRMSLRNLPSGCLDAAVARSFFLQGPSSRLPPYLDEAVEIIPQRLYWLTVPNNHR